MRIPYSYTYSYTRISATLHLAAILCAVVGRFAGLRTQGIASLQGERWIDGIMADDLLLEGGVRCD